MHSEWQQLLTPIIIKEMLSLPLSIYCMLSACQRIIPQCPFTDHLVAPYDAGKLLCFWNLHLRLSLEEKKVKHDFSTEWPLLSRIAVFQSPAVHWLCVVYMGYVPCVWHRQVRIWSDLVDKQEEYEEKIPWTFGVFPTLRQAKRKMMRIRGCFSRGLGSVSVKISCLAHLSEEREVLALTLDPSKAASIAARHSHAIGGKGGECQEAG